VVQKKLLARRKIVLLGTIPIVIIVAFMAVYLIQNNSSTTTSLQDGINTVIVNSNTTIITFGGTYSIPTTRIAKIVNNTWEFSVTITSGVYPPVLVYSNLTYISHKNASYEITNPIATLSVYKGGGNGTAIWSWTAPGATSLANLTFGASFKPGNEIPSGVLQGGVNYSVDVLPSFLTEKGVFLGDQLALNVSYIPDFLANYSSSPSSNNTFTTTLSSNNGGACNHSITFNGILTCAAPMNYSELYQLISNPGNTFTNYGNGTITLNIGHNPCTVRYYYLPNGTSVNEYLGVTNTETCE